MAEILGLDEANGPLAIEWDVASCVDIIARYSGENNSLGQVFRLHGREIDEYLQPLIKNLDKDIVLIVDSKSALRRFIGSGVAVGGGVDVYHLLNTVFSRVGDAALDRLNVAIRNGSIWNKSLGEVAGDIFLREASQFSDPVRLNSAVQALASAFAGRVVILRGNVYNEPLFIKALLPLIMRAAPGSVWILVDDRGVFSSAPVPSYEREYLHRRDLISALSQRLDVTVESTSRLIDKVGRPGAWGEALTGREFVSEFLYFESTSREVSLEDLPEVPEANIAPLVFSIKDGSLQLSRVHAPHVDDVVTRAVMESLSTLVEDVTAHHNLSNSMPSCWKKVERIGILTNEIILDDPDDGTVIRLGVALSALESSISHDPDDHLRNCRGDLDAIVREGGVFVNRFEAWRNYVSSSRSIDASNNFELAASTSLAILKDASRMPGVFQKDSVEQINRYIAQSESMDSNPERTGIISVVQNLLANASAFVKVQTIKLGSDMASLVREGGMKFALLNFLVAAQPHLFKISAEIPVMFSWLPRFLDWLKALAS